MTNFEQIFKDIDEIFCDVFIPNSRDLIESDGVQQQLFNDDAEFVPVTLAGISESCTLSIKKTYQLSELATAPKDDQKYMARNYEVIIERMISPNYLVRYHWSVYLQPMGRDVYVLPKHQWIINVDDSGKSIGQIDYAEKSPPALEIF